MQALDAWTIATFCFVLATVLESVAVHFLANYLPKKDEQQRVGSALS